MEDTPPHPPRICRASCLRASQNILLLFRGYVSLYLDLQLWRDRLVQVHHQDTALEVSDKWLFPNVHHLLQLGCRPSVTSCEAECSFSAFLRVKTVFVHA